MRIFKYVAASIFLIITVAAGVLVYEWVGKKAVAFKFPEISSDQRVEGVRLSKAVEGKKEWELKARSAEYLREGGITYLEFPEVIFFGKGRTIELKGLKGEAFTDSGNVNISGDVRVTTSDGYVLETDSMSYDSRRRVASTESDVVIKGSGIDIRGQGMTVDIGRDRISIKKDVRAYLEGNII